MRFLIIVCVSLILFSPAYAGWEGKFRCGSCGYESEALRVDCGTHSCYSVLYCDACKDFYSVLVSYDEAVIRKEYKPADADKTIKEFKKNLVKPLNEVFSEEAERKIKLFSCPRCGATATEMPAQLTRENTCSSASASREEKNNSFIRCPKCGNKTLCFFHTAKWD